VEDHDDTLQLYDAIFSGHGYWVARAENGLQALECAQDLQPNAIVTDIGLPGDMDGIDLIRELQADAKLCTVPVLLVTGRMPRDLPSFVGLPISALFLKPVAPETLVTKLESMLRASGSAAADAVQTSVTLLDRSVQPARESPPSGEIAPRRSSTASKAMLDKKRRLCPRCGTPLTWVETRRWEGVTYDYYRECTRGCGLACFNRTSRAFEVLLSAGDTACDN
jgi:DNA-binding response OmpR family regulator